jgi:hypothetical protein
MIYNTSLTLSESVKGFCRFWGVLKQFLRELEDEPEDLIGTGEDNIDEDEFNLFFNWVRGRNQYRLVEWVVSES